MLLSALLAPALAVMAALTGEPTVTETPATAAVQAEHPATYVRPVIAPFEPMSSFGRKRAQGDAETDHYRRPLIAPVSVDAYHRSYEYSPSDSETNYDQGVTQARLDAQALMGRLDGVWQVRDTQGRILSALVVSEASRDAPVEAAWSVARESDVATTARRDGDEIVIEAGLGASTTRLRLTPASGAWSGVLARGGRVQTVDLKASDAS